MTQFTVTSVGGYEAGKYVVTGFRVRGFHGSGSSSVEESETLADKAQADEIARRRNAGEKVPEVKWGLYADD